MLVRGKAGTQSSSSGKSSLFKAALRQVRTRTNLSRRRSTTIFVTINIWIKRKAHHSFITPPRHVSLITGHDSFVFSINSLETEMIFFLLYRVKWVEHKHKALPTFKEQIGLGDVQLVTKQYTCFLHTSPGFQLHPNLQLHITRVALIFMLMRTQYQV